MKPVCKDVEFARNLVAQMKEGYGRHNSNQAMRHHLNAIGCLVGELRRIGDDVVIRPDAQACQIGECFPFATRPAHNAYPFLKVIQNRKTPPMILNPDEPDETISTMLFERVRIVNSNGTLLLWKRIE